MKIKVNWWVSEEAGNEEFELEEMGCTEEEWNGFSEKNKMERIQLAIDMSPREVSRIADSFVIIN